MLTLLLYGAGEVWAQEPTLSANDIIIQVMPSGEEGKGSVTDATYGRVSASVSGRDVTLTVTPESGYQTNADLIIAEKMVDPDRLSARRRTPGTGTFPVTGSDNEYSFTIPVEYDGAYVTVTFVPTTSTATQITSLSQISSSSGNYILVRDIDASGHTSIASFSGTLEAAINPTTHMPYKIYNLSKPLFTSITAGGMVKNLILEDVSISETGNVGAIACQVTGTEDNISSIYNCGILSGSVSGGGYVGGLVGLLGQEENTTAAKNNCYARVINCYSYADITGGSVKAGIVGYNSYASKYGTSGDPAKSNIRTMVMNCMFYGHIDAGGTISPIYGGKKINNSDSGRLNNYNYFCYENLPSSLINEYNCALAAEERYLVRFEFYRHLLNSTREVASWYATGSTADAHSKMAKWVLDKDIAPYPILKEQGTYPSVVNYEDAPTLGTLSVSINLGSDAPSGATVSGTSLPIYDKNPDNYHFNYRTVRLPYFHEVGTGNYAPVSDKNYYKAVTGWRITGMIGGTQGSFTAADEWGGYNFADRSTYAKDIYSVSGRVFSQGAYFDVPDDVTGITIEPYWGNAVFLSDPYYDKYGYAAGDVTDFGKRYENGGTYSFGDLSLKVYTSFSDALNQLPSSSSVYDNAVVLVGNYHHSNGDNEISSGSKAFTITSIDLNEDNEPDYSLIYRSGKQKSLAPIRFDFINVPGAAMAHKTASSSNMGIPGNAKIKGWFEITNTALIHYSQFEYDSEVKSGSHPLILLGGVFEQIVSTNGKDGEGENPPDGYVTHTKYIHVGSNVWFKLFNNGCHLDKTKTKTPHIPISVTGGDYDKFYLSGYFQPAAKEITDNAECYISGGRFGEVAGAGQEPIKGDVTWLIDHADIKDFYGGGINDKKSIEGDITVTIKNSKVGTYCGGPKFGNMSDGKKVKTTATDCEFGTFYGAGFGGTSYYRYLWNENQQTCHNQFGKPNYEWNGSTWVGHTTYGFTSGTRGKYVDGWGILVNYDYEHFEGSTTNTVARLYMLYASLSLAKTKDVTSTLTGCTINNNFYGGGKLGSVDGDITSTLSNCTIKGNVYGAGYSGTPPTVDVFSTDGTNGGFKTIPNYNATTGVFEKGEYPDAVEYTWSSKGSVTNNSNAGSLTEDSDGNWIHTDTDLNDLGKVTGQVTLDIEEGTTIAGNVYGGGESSDVSVNEGSITSHVTVNVKKGTISGSVYGGGEGENTVVAGDVKVYIGTKEDGTPPTYTGDGIITISGNVYGGSGFGAVNASSTKGSDGNVSAYTPSAGKTTEVYIYGGTVNGSVFGGGLGQLASGTPGQNGYKPAFAAQNFGNTTVTIENSDNTKAIVKTAVYGGANVNGVIKSDATVKIPGGTVGTAWDSTPSEMPSVVFGGGKGQPTLVEGDVKVYIGSKSEDPTPEYSGNANLWGSVYGGSAMGAVNAYDDNGTLTLSSYTDPEDAGNTLYRKTHVFLYGGTVKGSVFGGGLGDLAAGGEGHADIAAQNFGNTTVTIENSDNTKAIVNTAVYGGANVNGVLKGNSTVTITGGTIGTSGSGDIKNVVFGGGFGQPTIVNGSVTVNIGTPGLTSDGAIYHGNIYGGSALGGVNVSDAIGTPTANTKTDVNLLKGTIYGNVFGGGLGRKSVAAVEESGTPGDPGYVAPVEGVSAIAAIVGGDVTVTLDGAQFVNAFTGSGVDYKPVTGQIFGANNLNGTPKGHVKVWVKRTVGHDKPTVDGSSNPVTRDQRPADSSDSYNRNNSFFDVAAVYGGGNQADYVPTDATLDPAVAGNLVKIEKAFAEVIIEGCEQTSIEYVYGGGNAAAVPATDVTILGDYIIDYVFGGGNGKGTGNPGADIGILDKTAYAADPSTGIYGTGKAVTKLVGGYIMNVFGGSNTKGNVRGGTTMTMPDKASYVSEGYDCCAVRDIKNIYGAGNEAEQDGAVTLILGCVDNMDYVYGGAKNAHVKGGVDLVVTSGHFKGVYGGNDTSGSIQGPITVTIEETGCDPLEIDNLYLGGKDAAYSIYGYKNTGTVDAPVLVARTKTEYDALTTDQKTAEGLPYADPVMNVVSCTRIGKTSGEDLGGVFGGGHGSGATMYGSPTVNINMIPGKYGDDTDSDGNPDIGIIRNVYGGGEEANVVGNTTVNIVTEPTVTVRSNMGAEIPVGDRTPVAVTGANITHDVFGAGKGKSDDVNSAKVTGNTTIVMSGGEVKQSVYGGGQLSQVTGNTNITVNGGTIGTTGEGGEIYGNVYGGGKGNTTNVLAGRIQGNTNITIQNIYADAAYAAAHSVEEGSLVSSPTVLHNIYGGGAHGSVGTFVYDGSDVITGYTSGGTANITITGGEIGTTGKENGMIFGSSRGDVGAPNSIHDKLAWVYDTEVKIGTEDDKTAGPVIKGSVYGGGENGHNYNDAEVKIYSGTIGINTGANVEYKDDPEDDTKVTYSGKDYNYSYRGNVYGAGCGTDMYKDSGVDKYNPKSGIVGGNATVIIEGGQVVHNVFGAGAMGSVTGSTSVKISGGTIGVDGTENGYVFAAARGDADEPTMATVGSSSLTISGTSTIKGSAFGGGQNGYVLGAVAVSMTGGTVNHDVYGGGALAETNTYIKESKEYVLVTGLTVGTSSVKGYYTESGGTYTAVPGDDPKAADGTDYYQKVETTVTLSGGTIEGDLYGGGLGRQAAAGPPAVTAVAADVNGPVTVTVSGGKAANVFGCNNLYGAPQSTVEVVLGTKTGASEPFTYGGTATVSGSVYGGGNLAAYTGNPAVKLYGGTVNTNVYGGGLGATAIVTGSTSVTMEGGTIGNDVFGGGSEADVTGSVSVSVTGGTVTNDVYGGGEKANTNTGNWDTTNDTWNVAASENHDYYVAVKHLKTGDDVSKFYTAPGTQASGTYIENTTYYKKLTYPVNIFNIIKSETDKVHGESIAADGHTQYTTTVSLTGGAIGNAYGGGLGKLGTGEHYSPSDCNTENAKLAGALKSATALTADQAAAYNETIPGAIPAGSKLTASEATAVNTALSLGEGVAYATDGTAVISAEHAKAYNAKLTGHKSAEDTLTEDQANAYNATLPGAITTTDWKTHPGKGVGAKEAMVYGDVEVTVDGTAFTDDVESILGGAENIAKHGRVFGCNNLNGTPKGKVTVTVNATKHINHPTNHVRGELELQAVYGGGNLANYEPETYDNPDNAHPGQTEFGQKTKVIINGCSNVSINKVYGGGNAASVPFTDVTIEGAYEIGYVFGGGNGGDKVNYGEGWQRNPGADVTHYANVMLKGGTIGQAFGGSDTRGTVGGTDVQQSTSTDCPLRIVNLYGAGNGEQALSAGDINVQVSACGEGSEVQNVFGGSYKANIKGAVTLTIKSGIFTSVYGGNDRMGNIGGNITVNIEETDDCSKPIIIQNLYGGCYQTAYPGVNAKAANGDDFTKGNIIVNVKSATRIDKIFGGSENGAVTGNTTVNINMTRGSMSGHSGVALPSYYGESGAIIPSNITVTDTEGGYVIVYGLVTDADVAADPTKERSSVVGYYTKADTYKLVGKDGDNDKIAEAGITYYSESGGVYTQETVIVGETVVSDFYTITATSYSPATGLAVAGITYYKQSVKGNIAPKIGTIGEVYGGGNMGYVSGNATVNIVTETSVNMVSLGEESRTVYGAHIDGNVYGGGKLADVRGDTRVNICAKETEGVYAAVPEGEDKVSIGGSVYGGGDAADVLSNTYVTMSGGYVFNGVFGGGYSGSVGTYPDEHRDKAFAGFGHTPNHDGCIGKPTKCDTGTGKCTVVVNGGQIGPVEVATQGMTRPAANGGPVPQGWVWGGGYGLIEDPEKHPDTHFMTYVNETDVTIGGTAFIMEGIIGGGEFGRVLGNTKVTIQDHCQIGVGAGMTEIISGTGTDEDPYVYGPKRYTDGYDYGDGSTVNQFVDPTSPSFSDANALAPCSHFTYASPHTPYDPYFKKYSSPEEYSPASTDSPSDGKTWIGVVFGGGSGYMPYEKEGTTPGYDWCRSAGWVEGNTTVNITGGHILSNVYGANEYTDVKGKATVKMSGGTIGVPRTLAQIAEAPTLCYLFGAGKGDQRSHFNDFTNVGSVEVEVSGGIIYGSVFGGAEDGHVLGNTSVTVRKGDPFTIGEETITTGPIIGTWGTSYVDGNIFGGGRGFSGEVFSAGNVKGNVTVNIEGGIMLGSIYGGGRMASVGTDFTQTSSSTGKDGYFLDDKEEYTPVLKGTILTKGDTYYTSDAGAGKFTSDGTEVADGTNYFTLESHGHVTVNVSGGIIGNDSETIFDKHTYGGNVYGGSMGRLTKLDGSSNPLWPQLGQVKTATVNITGNSTVIKGNVYGGGELGTVRDQSYVTVGGRRNETTGAITLSGAPTIYRDVYGGGYGSDDITHDAEYTASIETEYNNEKLVYTYTPLKFAGSVGKSTLVNIAGGWVKKNVYGGGEMASVGIINYQTTAATGDENYEHEDVKAKADDTGTTKYRAIKRHWDETSSFALSWPYEMEYIDGYEGTSTVNVTGGRVGYTGKDKANTVWGGTDDTKIDNGDIYGGCKGAVGDRYDMAFCGNVKNTFVNINIEGSSATPSDYKTSPSASKACITGSVYGGGENGHVLGNTSVTLTDGLIGHAIYGGGKGKDTYDKTLNKIGTSGTYPAKIYSLTAGKVFGNTKVTMNGGYVVRNIYGGGNMASVGKGNYAGGEDDYSTAGYGELAGGNLWTTTDGFNPQATIGTGNQPTTNADFFMSSGKTEVIITGGQVGKADGEKDDLPYGNVYGGCRGEAAPNVLESPRYEYCPAFFTGYVNETKVTIGTEGSDTGPAILGSVYGGGQDGHVRRDALVNIFSGEIGLEPTTTNLSAVGDKDENNNDVDLNHFKWFHRGNVYGSGSGIGLYKYDFNYNGRNTVNEDGSGGIEETEYENPISHKKSPMKEVDYSSSAGSVTRFTTVNIKGGKIHRNVYGGGSLATVGPPIIPPLTEPAPRRDDAVAATKGKQSLSQVNITGGIIGDESSYDAQGLHVYGGDVYAASRGQELAAPNKQSDFSTSIWTELNILGGQIYSNVYGGGELGMVKKNTNVNLLGGTIAHDAYGGGKGTLAVAADIGGGTTVELNKGVADDKKGCIVERIFGCNDLNGSPKGHVTVHVYATQNSSASKGTISDKFAKRPANKTKDDDLKTYLQSLIDATYEKNGSGEVITPKVLVDATKIKESVITAAQETHDATEPAATDEQLNTAINNVLEELCKLYDVEAVYGGGNLAPYIPEGPNPTALDDDHVHTLHTTEVVIEGCEVTSIRQVYGGGNAASAPATNVEVKSAYEIDELFGGGNGNDPYEKGGKWYVNEGANVGYTNYISHSTTTEGKDGSTKEKAYPIGSEEETLSISDKEGYRYGTGKAITKASGGRIHAVYGGSNIRGNISTTAMSSYQNSSSCALITDETYGGSKSANIDAEIEVSFDCVKDGGIIYGGSRDANLKNGVTLNITNGTYTAIYGGNNETGTIEGPITINIRESGCTPVIIGSVYAGGFKAAYSVYGYRNTGTPESPVYVPLTKAEYDLLPSADKEKVRVSRDPRINVISATRIGNIYGGGYEGLLVGNPHVNVNMEQGKVLEEYARENSTPRTAFTVGKHGEGDDAYTVESYSTNGDAILALGVIGTIFGGGDQADVYGNTYVEIGTGQWMNDESIYEMDATDGKTYYYKNDKWVYVEDGQEKEATTTLVPLRNKAVIKGNVYGGGKMGHVGDFTFTGGKPTGIKERNATTGEAPTGTCNVTISNGTIGPDNMQMVQYESDGSIKLDDDGNPLPPDDKGHVFGGGQGTLDYYYDTPGMTEAEKVTGMLALGATSEAMDAAMNATVGKLAFVDNTNVTINGTAFVQGCVFGGAENGHVLHDTHVNIAGDCQIGNGHILLKDGSGNITFNRGVNRRYTAAEWAAGYLFVVDNPATTDVDENDPAFIENGVFTLSGEETALRTAVDGNYTSSLPECASWPYGEEITETVGGEIVTRIVHAPYDKFADYPGYEPDGGKRVASSGRTFYGSVFAGGSGYFPYAPGHWLETAGEVEGDAYVTVTGGHILTSLYGGNEMSSVLGDTHVTMTGGTLGVPRTLAEIDAHPVTCYVFGGGKGEARSYLDHDVNVQNANVTVSGGWVYGSVFGGAEDGHVEGDATVTISEPAAAPANPTYADYYAGRATKIGTWGTSYVDGNIFGGGRGFDGHNQFAGCVEGNVGITISGGTMLGSVYGGGRLGSVGINSSGEEMDGDEHGHITVDISGGTIGNTNEFKYIAPDVTGAALTTATEDMSKTELESTTDKTNNRLKHTKGGNVFAGGMGRRLKLNGEEVLTNWTELGKAKSTKLTIGGTAWIMGNVYGGGEFGQVVGTHATKNTENQNINVGTEILINGGTIGTEITDSDPQEETITTTPSGVKYTFGSVYGGGYGTEAEIGTITAHTDAYKLGAYVTNNTYINMTAGLVRASVYGGGEIAAVGGNTNVNISGGEIGRNEVRQKSDPNPGYVMFGGSTMGNVFGGGKGTSSHTLVGVVKGNTTVNITQGTNHVKGDYEPFIYHNVYGGGAYGSVGTFAFSDGETGFMSNIPAGIPLNWTTDPTIYPTTGTATVNIKGGTIGISGRDNGMVNGSSRGDVAIPVPTVLSAIPGGKIPKDPYDKMAWVEQSFVNIGETGKAGPHIKGSVYGGGENGHVFTHAQVNVKSGTIGIVDDTDPWYDFGNDEINEKSWTTRGNVYGAGCGTDKYDSDGDGEDDTYNPWAGCVIGNTDINISGGLIVQSVYGGGSMGSVGRIDETKTTQHSAVANGFALSWPFEFVYQDLTVKDRIDDTHSTGKATIRITGGRIGTTGSDNGDVFGGSRGEAGPSDKMALCGNVRETEVNINFTPSEAAIKAVEDGGKYKMRIDLKDGDNLVNAIAGSVYGGSENGHVNENTSVTLTDGLIGHAIYGGGKGKGTYTTAVIDPDTGLPKEEAVLDPDTGDPVTDPDTGDPVTKVVTHDVYSLTAGKVYGNTNVTMTDGYVLRNIYGGGNLGSIGKGNYAGGSDDFTSGYGEKISGTLWTTAYDPNDANTSKDNAWYFLNSGKATVNVLGGTVGLLPESSAQLAAYEKDKLPTGNVFGGCRGEAAAENDELTLLLGYVNESDVTIGGEYKCIKECTDKDGNTHSVGEAMNLNEIKSLFNNSAIISGDVPSTTYWETISGSGPIISGSVYGGGQDGHVRRDTKVTVNKGEIGVPYDKTHREKMGTYKESMTTEELEQELNNLHWLHRGNVYGAGSGIGKYEYKYMDGGTEKTGEANSSSAGSVTRNTNVNILGGTIHRNVYGGGSLASVAAPAIAVALATDPQTTLTDAAHGKQSQCTVIIGGAGSVTIGTPDDYNEMYGGEVYGASRGDKNLDPKYFALSVWTKVNIKNGATIMGNVFGGGDAGKVLKDTDVIIGAE